MPWYVTVLPALGFALIHLFIGRLRFLSGEPRSRWLSAAGGAAVAYVFLHLMPELARAQEDVGAKLDGMAAAVEHHIWALSLVGLAGFYGLERAVRRGEGGRGAATAPQHEGSPHPAGRFWLHIGSFALYNLIIGYLLLHRVERDAWGLALYFVALGLHFLTSDYGLRLDHRRDYDRVARWVLAGAVLAGWAMGTVVALPEVWVDVLFALLAGGVVLNVLKEELPEERDSRFLPFALGTAGYGALLLAL